MMGFVYKIEWRQNSGINELIQSNSQCVFYFGYFIQINLEYLEAPYAQIATWQLW